MALHPPLRKDGLGQAENMNVSRRRENTCQVRNEQVESAEREERHLPVLLLDSANERLCTRAGIQCSAGPRHPGAFYSSPSLQSAPAPRKSCASSQSCPAHFENRSIPCKYQPAAGERTCAVTSCPRTRQEIGWLVHRWPSQQASVLPAPTSPQIDLVLHRGRVECSWVSTQTRAEFLSIFGVAHESEHGAVVALDALCNRSRRVLQLTPHDAFLQLLVHTSLPTTRPRNRNEAPGKRKRRSTRCKDSGAKAREREAKTALERGKCHRVSRGKITPGSSGREGGDCTSDHITHSPTPSASGSSAVFFRPLETGNMPLDA